MAFDGAVGVGLDGALGLSYGELRDAGELAASLGFQSMWTPSGGLPDSFHVCNQWLTTAGDVLRVGIAVVPSPNWTMLTLAARR